jgi:cytochrome c oxidase subunit 1
MIASIGAFGFGLSQLLFVLGVVKCARGAGEKAPDKPWEGADTLEWTLSSPPPYHSFETPPVVK